MTSKTTKSNEPIGVAIAGLGFGEAVHLPALKSNNSLKPIALWHPRKERLKDACNKHGLAGHNDWEKLLKDPNINAIVIATPPAPRFELAKTALEAGKHLLLEKPVCLYADQVAELQRIAMLRNLSVAVDFEYRAVPLFMQAKRLLQQGLIGKPWLVKLDWLMSSRANPSRPWNWYSLAEEGGGVIGALGTHAFDMLHWLIGPTKNASALLSTSISERPDKSNGKLKEVTSEDITLAHLELENITEKSAIPAQVTLSAVANRGRGCWLEIYGSKGTLVIGSDNQKDYVHGFSLWHASIGEQLRSVSVDKNLGFTTTWADGRIAPVSRLQGWWAESIRENKPMIPGLAEALTSQLVCDQVRKSASTGQMMPVSSTP